MPAVEPEAAKRMRILQMRVRITYRLRNRTEGDLESNPKRNDTYGSFHQVGAPFVTVSVVTSVNVPSIILDYKCTFTVVLQIRMKSISAPSTGNYNNVN